MIDRIPQICVCICTYKRPQFLRRLLNELNTQDSRGRFTYSIVIVDNDRVQSGRAVIDEFCAVSAVPVCYCVEPNQNIALARNKAVENASGDFIAFIDDDEFPAGDWLVTLFDACHEYKADGVLGPVRPFFEQEPPRWLVAGRFCERPEHKTGSLIHWQEARTGNVLLKKQILEGVGEVFRREFGSGSEDTDFFRRMAEKGCVFAWCNEAPVYEFVPPARWTRSYLLKRALLRGQNQVHLAGLGSIFKSVIAVPLYVMLLPFLLLFGHHRFIRHLVKIADHAGKLLGVIGFKPMGDKYNLTEEQSRS